jgi:O-antigen/teichoic acid export membrane protein
MSLRWLKASMASAVAQITRMICGLAVLKIVVIELGVDGVGKLGHFMNMLSILFVFAGGGINIGISKYVAQYESDAPRLRQFLSSAWTYSVAASVLIAVAFAALAHNASEILFGTDSYQWLIVCIGLVQFAFAYINFATGIVNGLRMTQAFSRISTIGSLLGLLPCYLIVSRFQLTGAVFALALVQAGLLIPAIYELRKLNLSRPHFVRHPGDTADLGRFSLMQLFSVATMPLVEIFIRTQIVHASGWDAAGMWQGVQRLSYASLSLFTSFLAVYYMPTLSAMKNTAEGVRYVFRTLAGILGAFAVVAVAVLLLRDFVFSVLLSKSFTIAPSLLVAQLIGDFFRIGSYVVGFYAVAKAATRIYVVCEIVQSALYVLAFYIVSKVEPAGQGVFIAYAVSNGCYFLFCVAGLLIYRKSVTEVSK